MMRRFLAAALVSLAIGALVAGCCPMRRRGPREITVRGVAEVVVPPDFVHVQASVVTLDQDVETAQTQNREKVKAVLAFVRKLGVEAKDIGTQYTSLQRKERRLRDKPPEFLGYEATNSIRVKLRDMKKYDELVAGVIKLGVNRIGGVDFGATDEIEKRKEARLLAIKAARAKAEYLAAALGQQVGRPLWVSEFRRQQQQWGAPNWASNAAVYIPPGAVGEADTEQGSIAPGSKTIRAQVEVSFRLWP